ncbi:MAG: Gfo/Idh/MocA family oxidoreductase, partial [Verrucomicrobia bacterium]|nr:Gfo/Idh/MocA family oxidoreductase [Verrucomicrobiota bacterium]
MHDELHWGMIGCGAVTETKSGPAFDRVEGSRLVAVASRTPGHAQDWATRHGTPRWHADPAELLADDSLNAIYVATPPDAHAGWAIRAAQAGKPVVLVEKPLARSAAEARRIVDACRESGAHLHVAYYRRTLPAFLQIKRWIDEGAIGAPRAVMLDLCRAARPDESNRQPLPWRVRPEVGGGGHFADLAPHQFDFLDFVLGPVRAPEGDARNTGGLYAAEDTVDAAWRHDGGVACAGSWRFCSTEGAYDHAVVAGETGRIEF